MIRRYVLMAVVCAFSSSAFAEFGLGCLPEPPGALAGIPLYSKPPPPKPGPQRAFGLQPGQLPSSIDNSLQSYFPPIGNQGSQDSCSAWVTTYYYLSYLQRRDKGWSGGASSNVCSPAFTYNQLRADEGGSVISDCMKMLARIGACTLADMPYDVADDNTQPDEVDFRNAAEFRTLGFSRFVITNDEAVILLKQHLASTNIAVSSMRVYSDFVFANANGTTNVWGRGNVPTNANVMVGQSGSYEGGHAVTIVGYDDNKVYGTNVAEKGAFKLANSWGTDWGNQGFFWVSYEYFKTCGTNLQWNDDNECFVMWDREGYTPKAYMTIRLTHPLREQIRLAVGVKDHGYEAYRYYYYGCAYAARTDYTNPPYLYTHPGGATNSPDLVLDVSELLHYTKDNANTTWMVFLGDACKDGITGTVDTIKIESYGVSVETNLHEWIYEDMADGEALNTQIPLDVTINRPDPQILLVDEDYSGYNYRPDMNASNYRCYEYGYEIDPLQTLTALAVLDSNLEFQAINMDTQVNWMPAAGTFPVVYWLTGKYATYANPSYSPLYYPDDFQWLTSHLGQGGRLLLEGESICPSLGNSDPFVTNWLRVGSTAWESNDPPPMIYLNGVTNDPVSDGMCLPYAPDFSDVNYQQRANRAEAGNGAVSLFTRADDGNACGVRFDSGNYRVIYFPFELFGIGDVKDRYTLIRRSLEWIAANDLVVASANGGALPAVGTNSYRKGTAIECRVTNSPVTAGSTQFVCAGWSGSGSVSAGGSGINTSFVLTNNSSIAWLWTTNYYLAVAAGEHGAVDNSSGWKAFGSNVSALATASNYYHFGLWTGDVPGSGVSNNPVVFVMNGPRSIEALFVENLVTNGTPEWWLASYGWTNNFDVAATNDADIDGMATWEEWVSLTDPTNRSDVFEINAVGSAPGSHVVSWTSRAGRYYDVAWFTNFTSEAGMLSNNIVYPQNSYTDTVNASKALIFYRVRVRK